MNEQTLDRILSNIKGLRVLVVGDACLDIYWHADMKRSTLSRETPHHPLPIVRERMTLGGAGNVVSNVKALGIAQVSFIGFAGNDWRGKLMAGLFEEADVPGLLFSDDVTTNAYIKPMRHGISDVVYEDPRLDFENRYPLSEEDENTLIAALESAEADVVLVCDQMENGCITPRVRAAINRLGLRLPVFADSRHNIMSFENVIIKPNEVEAFAAVPLPQVDAIAAALHEKTKKPVVITLGREGALYHNGKASLQVPAFNVPPPVDFVGAGDTFFAAFGCAYAVAAPDEAITLGHLASSITIRKLGTTGTASPEELREALWGYNQ